MPWFKLEFGDFCYIILFWFANWNVNDCLMFLNDGDGEGLLLRDKELKVIEPRRFDARFSTKFEKLLEDRISWVWYLGYISNCGWFLSSKIIELFAL